METNGDAFLPDLPVLGQPAEWTLDQVAPEPASILPDDSDASQDATGQHQPPDQINSTELGSVEKAVEQFQLASAQLFQEEQPPPPPPPPPQPSEHAAEPLEPQPQDASQGYCCLHADMHLLYTGCQKSEYSCKAAWPVVHSPLLQ